MGVGDEELVDPVFFLGGCRLLAAPAAPLGTVFGQRLALDVAGVGECDHHVLRRDQVFGIEFGGVHLDHRPARVVVLGLHRSQLVGDDLGDALGSAEDVEQVGDLADHLAVFLHDLVLLEPCEPL